MNDRFFEELAVHLTQDVQEKLILALLLPGSIIQENITRDEQVLIEDLKSSGFFEDHAARLIQLLGALQDPLLDNLLAFCLGFNVDRVVTQAPPHETGTPIEIPSLLFLADPYFCLPLPRKNGWALRNRIDGRDDCVYPIEDDVLPGSTRPSRYAKDGQTQREGTTDTSQRAEESGASRKQSGGPDQKDRRVQRS